MKQLADVYKETTNSRRLPTRASDKVVAQIFNLLYLQVCNLPGPTGIRRLADFKSAIQQIANLRYIPRTCVDFVIGRRLPTAGSWNRVHCQSPAS